MGIKEYFEKQPEKDLKFQDLDLEVEKEEEVFDLEKEITEKDWQEIKDFLKDGLNFLYDRRVFISDLKKLAPGRYDDLEIDTKMLFNITRNELGQERKKRDGDRFIISYLDIGGVVKRAEIAKILAPKRFTELNFDQWQDEIIEDLKRLKENKNYFGLYVSMIVSLKIINPDKLTEYGIDDEQLEEIWKKEKLKLDEFRRNNRWLNFESTANELRILFPERVNELGLDKQTLDKIRQATRFWRQTRDVFGKITWQAFVQGVLRYKTLAAKEIKFTDHGLELVMEKKDFKRKEKPRPERKRF